MDLTSGGLSGNPYALAAEMLRAALSQRPTTPAPRALPMGPFGSAAPAAAAPGRSGNLDSLAYLRLMRRNRGPQAQSPMGRGPGFGAGLMAPYDPIEHTGGMAMGGYSDRLRSGAPSGPFDPEVLAARTASDYPGGAFDPRDFDPQTWGMLQGILSNAGGSTSPVGGF